MTDPLTDCFNLASRRLVRVTAQIYDLALAPAGLKVTQFSVLTAVDRAKDHDLSLKEIAAALDMEQSSLTRSLSAFVRDGFVTLNPAKDRRQKAAQLTPKGEALLAQATQAWTKAQNDIREKLGQSSFDNGLQLLHEMRHEILSSEIPTKKVTT